MPDPNGLQPHDVQHSEQTVFDQLGRPVKYTIIRYSIGVHGPFTDEYPSVGLTAPQINAGYAERIKLIRATTDPQNIPQY